MEQDKRLWSYFRSKSLSVISCCVRHQKLTIRSLYCICNRPLGFVSRKYLDIDVGSKIHFPPTPTPTPTPKIIFVHAEKFLTLTTNRTNEHEIKKFLALNWKSPFSSLIRTDHCAHFFSSCDKVVSFSCFVKQCDLIASKCDNFWNINYQTCFSELCSRSFMIITCFSNQKNKMVFRKIQSVIFHWKMSIN